MYTTEIISTVGRIITKTILSNIFNDPVADITDEFFLKISDDYLQARAHRRFFEAFMDRYSDNFEKILEISKSKPTKKKMEFFVGNIERVFSEYDFSLRNLIAMTFDVEAILSDIMHTQFANKNQYSTDEWSQLCAVIRLSVVFVIDVSSKIQDYNALTTRETLKRINSIKRELTNLINDYEKNRIDLIEKQELASSSIEMEYKTVLRRYYSKINVFGANLTPETKRYMLKEAYVTLNACDYEDGISLQIHEFLQENFLIILGEAGTGKTTFINWLAINSVIYSDSLPGIHWENKIPFIIELRKYPSGISFDTIRSIVSGLVPRENTDKWIEDVFESGRAVLLIDGMDEISSQKREDVIEWVLSIINQYRIKVVITARPSVFDEIQDSLEIHEGDELFKTLMLEPMSEELTELFIKNWHMAVSKNLKWEKKDVLRFSKKLFAHIKSTRSLKDLASYPLLCAMICGLWHNNDMVLPKTRNAIYDECCKMLIEGRDEKRAITHEIGYKMTEQQKFAILDDIAYWMQVNNYSSSTKNVVIARIQVKIRNMSSDINDIGADRILEYLVERSGILRNPSGSDIDFIHKTFQEYLAARVIMKNCDYGILIDHVPDYTWNETFLLAMGFATKSDADEIMKMLLNNGRENKHYYCVAIACFNIPTELSPNVRAAVADIMEVVIPPKNDHEVKLLSSAPETIVSYLGYNSKYTEEEKKHCINTLLMINTIQSLDVLSEYFNKSSESIKPYILNAIEKLDIHDIIESKLSLSLLDYAFNKRKNTATITPFIAKLCKFASYKVSTDLSTYRLGSAICFTCLMGIGEISECYWSISEYEANVLGVRDAQEESTEYMSLAYLQLKDVRINKLILSLKEDLYEISLALLSDFGSIKQITLNQISVNQILHPYVFADIEELTKLHFVCDFFDFDSFVTDILYYFKDRKIEIEITAKKVLIGTNSLDDNLLNKLSSVIINDNDRIHKSSNNIESFLFEYSCFNPEDGVFDFADELIDVEFE